MPLVLARDEIHDWVVDALSRGKKGFLLDIPTGAGALALRLREMGFTVTCCDINPSLFSVPDLECKRGDLNQCLPYPSESFDFIVCIEGLEHVENPFNAIREFYRLLKSGGRLVLSTPNYLNIERRLKFLVTGLFSKVPLPQNQRKDRLDNLWMQHITILTYPILRLILEFSGFKILRIGKDKEKKRMKWLLPVVWSIQLYCFFWPEKKKEEYHLKDTLSSLLMMGGNTLMVMAEKEGPLGS